MCFGFEALWTTVNLLRLRSKYFESEASTSVPIMGEPSGAARPDPVRLGAYFALMESGSLIRHAVEQQLTEAGGLSYVQFQLLATLGDSPDGSRRMTDLADGVVYSRSGLTYQAQALEKRGLVTRTQSEADERGVTVTITDAGRDVLAAVFPGHIAVLHDLLFAPLTDAEISGLDDVLGRVRDHLRAHPPRSASGRRRGKSGSSEDSPAGLRG